MAERTTILCDFDGMSKEHMADFSCAVEYRDSVPNGLPGDPNKFDSCGRHLAQLMNDRWRHGALVIKVVRRNTAVFPLEEKKEVPCPYCTKVLGSNQGLAIHISRAHPEKRDTK